MNSGQDASVASAVGMFATLPACGETPVRAGDSGRGGSARKSRLQRPSLRDHMKSLKPSSRRQSEGKAAIAAKVVRLGRREGQGTARRGLFGRGGEKEGPS